MTPAELAALLISAAIKLKSAGMVLDKDPSENFNDLATLVSIAYAENQQGENIGTGQSTLLDKKGKQEKSFGPFQVNKFWYKDHTDKEDVTLVNNEFTDVFDDKSPEEMEDLVQIPENAALAAVIIANSNNGYENWSVYNKEVYGIKDQDFDSEFWRTGFNAAAEEYFKLPEADMEEEKLELEKLELEKLEREKMEREKMEREKMKLEPKPSSGSNTTAEANPTPNRMPVFTPQGPFRGRTPVFTSQAELEGRTPVEQPNYSLGQAMRARGYGDREVVRFQRQLDNLIAEFFPGEEDNEEVIRQTTIAAAQSIGMPSNAMSIEEAQNLDTVKNVVTDFIYQIGKRKAMLIK